MLIRPPPTWGLDKMSRAMHPPAPASPDQYWADPSRVQSVPEPRRIGLADLKTALRLGLDDLGAFRTDVVFLCVAYPLIGLLMARLTLGEGFLPLLFPLASGFALVGPLAAVGLNEMSRRRERNIETTWADNFAVLRSPARGQILLLGLGLVGLLLVWMFAAQGIYDATLGPRAPESVGQFARDVLGTPAGWAMIVAGVAVGFLFAVLVLTIGAVAFPMMLDRNVSAAIAVRTSVRVVLANKATMACWGLIVAGLLVLGSIPAFLGLILVMPVLGHATWHLYRAAVPH